MRLFFAMVSVAALTWAAPVQARHGPDCKREAVEHLQNAPDGLAIYGQVSDRGFFQNWIDCSDAQFDLPTAVHESTHFITAETDGFPLIGGGAVKRPHEVSGFFPPSRIAHRFKPGGFGALYLKQGNSSSATDFLYLLDELNAYAHGLATAVDLRGLSRPDETIDHRDGLAAMMAFVAVYAETAESAEPATWDGLRQPAVARTIRALWRQGERVIASSCGIPNFGAADKPYIRQFCDARARAALTPILGGPPVCPTACLIAEPETTVADETEAPDAVDPPPASPVAEKAEPISWLGRFLHSLGGAPPLTK